MTFSDPRFISYAAAGVGIAVLLFFRLRAMRRAKPLKLERLWIIPALYTAFACALFWKLPPHGLQWLTVTAALAVGAGVGWLRGSTMRIAVDPVTHDLNQRQSPAALVLLVALIGMRYVAREHFGGDLTHAGAGVIDAFVAFAVGLLALQRVEMFLRARRLLGEARARRTT
ncbi:cytochrome c biogenesis protein CcdC [Sphingosinicellaceae bacterium]|nr:cytochrome c biogenesis protein CcdC [Sphingosinicellaceae bacterium]